MNKSSITAIVAVVVIVGTVGYSFLNVYAADNLQFRWNQKQGFDFVQLLNGGTVQLCNATPIPLDFKNFEIEPYHRDQKIGTYHIDATVLQPFEPKHNAGKIKNVNDQLVSIFLESNLGTQRNLDLDKISVDTKVNVAIVGVIPYTLEKTYSGGDFVSIMNHENRFDC